MTSAHRRKQLLLATPLATLPLSVSLVSPSMAQDRNSLGIIAQAVEVYQASAEECHYADEVGTALERIDQHFTATYSYRWTALKQATSQNSQLLRGTARALGSDSDCKTYGLAIGNGLGLSIMIVAFDPVIMSEADRLSGGGGRSKAGSGR